MMAPLPPTSHRYCSLFPKSFDLNRIEPERTAQLYVRQSTLVDPVVQSSFGHAPEKSELVDSDQTTGEGTLDLGGWRSHWRSSLIGPTPKAPTSFFVGTSQSKTVFTTRDGQKRPSGLHSGHGFR